MFGLSVHLSFHLSVRPSVRPSAGVVTLSRGARDSKIGKKWPESSRILDYILC